MKKSWVVIITFLFVGCNAIHFKKKWTREAAPENYTTRFETTKGNFDIKITRNLSPMAADRFYQLVKHHYFDDMLFYRVKPGFVAQFGSSDSLSRNQWDAVKVPDEETIQGNERGALSFARGGKETRTTDLFVNLGNNNRLDTLTFHGVKGFPSFGKVTKGMAVLDSLYSGYSDTVMDNLELMYSDRRAFLKQYPRLDKIKKVYLIDK